MPNMERDEIRENRIEMEIIVDAYNSEEQAMGWYYYLDDTLNFPFQARCIAKRRTSPLAEGENVEVLDMSFEDECLHEMFVEIRWQNDTLSVPLAQIEAIDGDEATQCAIADWHYWVNRGYEF